MLPKRSPGSCSRPVPTLTGVAGNGGVRSSGRSPRAPVPSGSHRPGKIGRVKDVNLR